MPDLHLTPLRIKALRLFAERKTMMGQHFTSQLLKDRNAKIRTPQALTRWACSYLSPFCRAGLINVVWRKFDDFGPISFTITRKGYQALAKVDADQP